MLSWHLKLCCDPSFVANSGGEASLRRQLQAVSGFVDLARKSSEPRKSFRPWSLLIQLFVFGLLGLAGFVGVGLAGRVTVLILVVAITLIIIALLCSGLLALDGILQIDRGLL